MLLSSNLIGFYDYFGMEKTIEIFADAGFQAIDFNLDLSDDCNDESGPSLYYGLKAFAAERGIRFCQTHAPFARSSGFSPTFEHLTKSLQKSSWLGADMVVVHPLYPRNYRKEDCYQEMFDCNLDFYRRLAPYAREYGVKIAIENIPKAITDTPEGLIQLFDALNDPAFTVCFDVGHANLVGEKPSKFIRALGDRLGCTHIHDNDSISDSHILPYHGDIQWEAVMKALADIGYTGNLNYEAGHFVRRLPEELRPQAAGYMAQVGFHLIDLFHTYQTK